MFGTRNREDGFSLILGLVLAVLPFSMKLNVYMMALLIIVWLYRVPLKTILRVFSTVQVYKFVLFYFICVIAVLWSCNIDTGLFVLEKRASMFLIPLILLSYHDKIDYDLIFKLFLMACSIAFVYCFAFAHYQWWVTGDKWIPFRYFNFTKNAIGIHPGYLSIYLVVCIIYELEKWSLTQTKRKSAYIFLIIFHTLAIFYIGTKSAFFIVLAILLSYLVKSSRDKRTIARKIFGFFLILTLVSTLFYSFSYGFRTRVIFLLNGRYNNFQERFDIYKSIWTTIQDSPFKLLFGYGTGCFIHELISTYKELSLHEYVTKRLDVHNIFIKGLTGQGVFGMASIFLMFQGLQIKNIRKDFSYFLFSVTFLLFGMIEHFLDLQHGIVLFAFFNILFFKRGLGGPDKKILRQKK